MLEQCRIMFILRDNGSLSTTKSLYLQNVNFLIR